MVGIRERLHITVIRNGNGFMAPFHGSSDNIFHFRDAVHITHFCMAVEFHPFLRAGVHTN